jgi:hypothetical protein
LNPLLNRIKSISAENAQASSKTKREKISPRQKGFYFGLAKKRRKTATQKHDFLSLNDKLFFMINGEKRRVNFVLMRTKISTG